MIKNLMQKILKGSFQEILFWSVLFFCFLAACISTIFTAVENLGMLATIYTAFIALYFVIVGLIAHKTKKIETCYTVTSFAIITFILPPSFFICGAFDSGMPFYCLTSILVIALIKNFKTRCIMLAYSVLVNAATFLYDWKYPDFSQELAPVDAIVDKVASFGFMAILIFTIVSFLQRSYNRERAEKDKLIEKLDYLSTHDPLTGLFNRRSFIQRINEVMQQRAGHFYLLMFDVDFFKRVNDTYGHVFGDQVLTSIGKTAADVCHRESEMAVRYGGEEFILLLEDESYSKAFVRAEQFRHQISAIKFQKHPEIHVHISGGFIDCCEYSKYDELLTAVDKLLYTAKVNGRDQIVERKK